VRGLHAAIPTQRSKHKLAKSLHSLSEDALSEKGPEGAVGGERFFLELRWRPTGLFISWPLAFASQNH